MRHPLRPALLVVVLLATYAVGGAALAEAGSTPEPVTVEGTVTDVDGTPAANATVLVGDRAMLRKLSPDELRDVAADDPGNLVVLRTDADGSFAAEVPSPDADAAVALDDDGVSRVVRLGNQGATLALQLHEHRPQTVYPGSASLSVNESTTRLYVGLVNNDDVAIENLTVTVTGLPDGWSVAGAETNGAWDADDRTMTWADIPPGGEADAALTLEVPGTATVGSYAVALAAASDSHPVAVENATVEVRPERTPGPTRTSVPGGEGSTPTDRIARTTSLAPTDTTTPGMGVGVGVLALLGAAAFRRGDSA